MAEHPLIEIRHRWRDEVLYSTHACPDLKAAVEEAAVKGASLEGAGLVGASLEGANLEGGRMVGANLYVANLEGANLNAARLIGAHLEGARMVGARMIGANLVAANLADARLDGADLYGANLEGTRLVGASLEGTRINWSSRPLVAEILLRAAGDEMTPLSVRRRKVAGLVLVSRDWCWPDFLRLRRDPHFAWAVDVLAARVVEGDNAPDILRDRAASLKAAATPAPNREHP